MTPQTKATLQELKTRRHASNLELLTALQPTFPDISATTIHRITKRLVDEKQISMFMSPHDGSMLLDANPVPHYHFICQACGKVRDIDLSVAIIDEIKKAAGISFRSESLIITGIKADCPYYKAP